VEFGAFRSIWNEAPDARLFTVSHAQILVVYGAPSQPHRDFLIAAQAAGCPSIVLLWGNGARAAVRELLAGLDTDLITLALPAGMHTGDEYGCATVAVPIPAPRVADDRRLDEVFPELRRYHTSAPAVQAERADAVLALVSGADDLVALAPALRRATERFRLRVIVVGPAPDMLGSAVLALGLTPVVLDESDRGWLGLLGHCRAVIVSARGDALSLRGSLWTLAALRAGAPTVAAFDPLLEPLLGTMVVDGWDRGLGLYCSHLGPFRSLDRAVALAKLRARNTPATVAAAWTAILSGIRRPVRPRPAAARVAKPVKPLLVVLFDLAQDLDVLWPVVTAIRAHDRLSCHIVITDWLERESPRTFGSMIEAGIRFEVLPRERALAGCVTWPAAAKALLTASESSLAAHTAGYAVTRAANAAGLMTFTVQHGFENVGLTYIDPIHGADVLFASERIFIWGRKEALPAWVAPETRGKVISTGIPTIAPPPANSIDMPAGWERVIGVFENLHWHRYSPAYKTQLQAQIRKTVRQFSRFLFLFKPHHAGRFLMNNPDFLPRQQNVLTIDPLDPKWHRHTAPALIAGLDAVVTTPSTVAVDAARAGRPVAIIGNDLALPLYDPLPVIRDTAGWSEFLASLDDPSFYGRNEAFLRRHALWSGGGNRIAVAISDTL
jgi:hypothetical protein